MSATIAVGDYIAVTNDSSHTFGNGNFRVSWEINAGAVLCVSAISKSGHRIGIECCDESAPHIVLTIWIPEDSVVKVVR